MGRAEKMPKEQDEVGEAGSDQGVGSLVGPDKGNRYYAKHNENMRGF